MDFLLSGLERRPVTPAPLPPAAITLAYLASAGINRISVWCRACRTSEHRPLDGIAAEFRALPIAQLGNAVRCEACAGSTTVTAFTESQLRHARPHDV